MDRQSSHLPSGYRLRAGRCSMSRQIYHITATTHNRTPWFDNLETGRVLVKNFQRCRGTHTIAFVVMPDHYHWLMQLQPGATLQAAVQFVHSATAHSLNQLLSRRGKLWQGGYYDRAIRMEEDIQSVARYLIANPLRAGLVRRIGDYPLWDAIWL